MNFSPRTLRTGALAAAVFALFASGAALAGPDARDINVEPNEEGSHRSDIKVSAWVDRRDATYRSGDTITLRVKVNKPTYITVIDIGTSGRVHVIFPNKYQHNNRVGAFEVVQIPDEGARFHLAVNGPSGEEVLKVFATEKPIDYLDISRLSLSGPFYSVPGDAGAVTKDIDVELNRRHRFRYGVATKVVRIIGRRGEFDESSRGRPAGEQDYSRGPDTGQEYGRKQDGEAQYGRKTGGEEEYGRQAPEGEQDKKPE